MRGFIINHQAAQTFAFQFTSAIKYCVNAG